MTGLEYLVYDLTSLELEYKLTGIISPWLLLTDNGFYYERFDDPKQGLYSLRKNQRIVHHVFGTDPSKDRLVFYNQDRSSVRSFYTIRPRGSKWIYVFHPYRSKSGWREAISLIDLSTKAALPRPFVLYESQVRFDFQLVLEKGNEAYFRTNMLKPNYELLKFNLEEVNAFEVVMPEFQEVLVDAAYLGNGHFGLSYLNEGAYSGLVIDETGASKLRIPVEGGAAIDFYRGVGNKPYFDLRSFHLKSQQFGLNLEKGKIHNPKSSETESGIKNFKVEDRTIPTKDGEEIPVKIIYYTNKVKKNGQNPTLIYVYGGYGQIDHPSFSWYYRFFVKNGGVLVFPGVRGSGAKGTQWALSGRGALKQNTIDDIVTTAEYLIKSKFTSPQKLFLEGGSHGGFAVAAAGIQKPQLFKGIIAKAGVYDLIRLTEQSVGHAEINRIEFGNPQEAATFQVRHSLSPLHNLTKNVRYPSFLLITGTNDTRVPPAHSYRFMALLNRYSLNRNNFLHTTQGGHGLTNNIKEELELMALRLKFIALDTDHKFWLN